MKKALTITLCLFNVTVFAQDGFFLQPFAGTGAGNVKNSYNSSTNDVFTFDAGVDAGYCAGPLVFSAGLGYLRTGYSVDITYTDALGNPISTSKFYTYFNHIIVPLSIGYQFKTGRKFSIIPAIGGDFSYNISARETVLDPLQPGQPKVEPMPSEEFSTHYDPLSIFGVVKIGLDYKLSSNLTLTCAPTFDYMLTNMFRIPDNSNPVTQQHNYALLVNMGIKWNFERRVQQAGNENVPGAN